VAIHKSISDYYLYQQLKAEKYLERCLAHADPEVVHQLRLCIKKLKAYDLLADQLGFEDHEENRELTFSVKKLFRLAGQIRDIQVQLHLLSVHETKTGAAYPEFSQWLLKRENKRISRLFSSLPRASHHSSLKTGNDLAIDALFLLNDKSIENSADKVLNNLHVKIQKLAAGEISDANLHLIRKTTKRIRYILNMLYISNPNYNYDRITNRALREIEMAAGKWHDYLVRNELIDRFIKKIGPEESPGLIKYKHLSDVCSAELETAYKKACRIVKRKMFVQMI